MSTELKVQLDSDVVDGCETVIVVPEKALAEAGYIKSFTLKDSGHAKHELHALAQMVYFQYQDEELEVIDVGDVITVADESEKVELRDGMILFKLTEGTIKAAAQGMINRKKYLEAAYRYCTRWVRLDI